MTLVNRFLFSRGQLRNQEEILPDDLAHFHQSCSSKSISEEDTEALLASISPSKLKAYFGHWSRFVRWTHASGLKNKISFLLVSDFLLHLQP